MDFEFSADAIMLRDMLRRFIEDEAKPLEMKYFSAGGLEDQERARLRTVVEQMGLWGITVPENFGGGGLDLVTACLLEEELGKTFLPMELGDVPPLLYVCQGNQVDKFLNPALEGKRHAFFAAREPNAFKPADWQTTANQDGGAFFLNGKKILSSMPSAQDFFVVLAKDAAGISAFMVEQNQSGVTISKNGNITLSLNQCRTESILGESGHALELGAETTPAAGIRLGARYVGLASRLLDMSAEYARTWTALGALLKERPAIQRILAEVKVQIESTRWLVYHAAWVADKNGATRELAAQVRLASSEMLSKTTNLITLVYGGPGPSPEVEIHRYVQSVIPMESLEYGLQIARLVIANELTAVNGG